MLFRYSLFNKGEGVDTERDKPLALEEVKKDEEKSKWKWNETSTFILVS